MAPLIFSSIRAHQDQVFRYFEGDRQSVFGNRPKNTPELESLSENVPKLFSAQSLGGTPQFPSAKQTTHNVQSKKNTVQVEGHPPPWKGPPKEHPAPIWGVTPGQLVAANSADREGKANFLKKSHSSENNSGPHCTCKERQELLFVPYFPRAQRKDIR